MYGTLSTLDTLKSNFQSVMEFDERLLAEALLRYLEAHNGIMQSLMNDLIERTTDKERVFGTADVMEMVRTDQWGAPDAQKIGYGVPCGFPLESFQGTLQWTRKFFQTATVSEIANQYIALQAADRQRVVLEAKRALFNPTDYTFNDYLMNRRSILPLQVRALVNADGLNIPPGPNGEIFDGTTHTHYLGTAAFAQSDLVALIETVLEHYNEGEGLVYINRAQEPTIRSFTNFVPYLNTNIVGPITAAQIPSRSLEFIRLYNRAIGQFNGAEVWVKPWIPTSYIFAFLRNQTKPLVMRTRIANGGNLELVDQHDHYPLRCEGYEREPPHRASRNVPTGKPVHGQRDVRRSVPGGLTHVPGRFPGAGSRIAPGRAWSPSRAFLWIGRTLSDGERTAPRLPGPPWRNSGPSGRNPGPHWHPRPSERDGRGGEPEPTRPPPSPR